MKTWQQKIQQKASKSFRFRKIDFSPVAPPRPQLTPDRLIRLAVDTKQECTSLLKLLPSTLHRVPNLPKISKLYLTRLASLANSTISTETHMALYFLLRDEQRTNELPFLLESMLSDGIDVQNLDKMYEVHSAILGRDLDGAHKLVHLLRKAGVKADGWLFNELILSNLNAGDNGRANTYFMWLRDDKACCSEETILALLQSFAKTGNVNRVTSIIKYLKRQKRQLDAQHYFYMIDALCSRGSVLKARDTIQEMILTKVSPSTEIFNRIIKAYLDQRDPNPAPNLESAFFYVREMARIGVEINETTLDLVTAPLLDPATRMVYAARWLIIVEELGFMESTAIANYRMQVELDSSTPNAEPFTKSIKKPDSQSFDLKIRYYLQCNDFKSLVNQWNCLKALSGRLSTQTSLIILQSMIIEDCDLAETEFTYLLKSGNVNVALLDDYLLALSKKGRFDKFATSLYAAANTNNLTISRNAYQSVREMIPAQYASAIHEFLTDKAPYVAKDRILILPRCLEDLSVMQNRLQAKLGEYRRANKLRGRNQPAGMKVA